MTLDLQRCQACGTWNVPARQLCHACLSDNLEMREVGGAGTVVASVLAHVSLDPRFLADGPFGLATIILDAGPTVIASSAGRLAAGARVTVTVTDGPRGPRMFAA